MESVTNPQLPSASISPSVLGVTPLNSQSGSKGVRQSKKSHSTLLRVKSPLSSRTVEMALVMVEAEEEEVVVPEFLTMKQVKVGQDRF